MTVSLKGIWEETLTEEGELSYTVRTVWLPEDVRLPPEFPSWEIRKGKHGMTETRNIFAGEVQWKGEIKRPLAEQLQFLDTVLNEDVQIVPLIMWGASRGCY